MKSASPGEHKHPFTIHTTTYDRNSIMIRMAEFNAGDLEGMLDFFILSGFSDGPQSLLEIQKRVNWAEGLLLLTADRKGMGSLNSVTSTLERLQREGWRKLQRTSLEITYSLTESGEQRLEQERARRHFIASQFVEDSELDSSFRKFLNRHNPL